MGKNFAKRFKNFAVFSTCLVMLLAPNTSYARKKVTNTKNVVRKVLKKNKNKKRGKKLTSLAANILYSDILSFSTKGSEGGNGKYASFDVKYNKSNKEVTQAIVSIPKKVTSSAEEYEFTLAEVKLSYKDKTKTISKSSLSNNIMSMDLGKLEDIENGDVIKAKVGLTWYRTTADGRRYRSNGIRYFDMEIKINFLEEEIEISVPENKQIVKAGGFTGPANYEEFSRGDIHTSYTSIEEISKNIDELLSLKIKRNDWNDYEVSVKQTFETPSDMNVYFKNNKGETEKAVIKITKGDLYKGGKFLTGLNLTYGGELEKNGVNLNADKDKGDQSIEVKVKYKLRYNGVTYENTCSKIHEAIALPDAKVSYLLSQNNYIVIVGAEITGKNLTLDNKYYKEKDNVKEKKKNGNNKYEIKELESFSANWSGELYVLCKDDYGDLKLPLAVNVNQLSKVVSDPKNKTIIIFNENANAVFSMVCTTKESNKYRNTDETLLEDKEENTLKLVDKNGKLVDTKTYSNILIKIDNKEVGKNKNTVIVGNSEIKGNEKITVTYTYNKVNYLIEINVPKDIEKLKNEAIAPYKFKDITPIYSDAVNGEVKVGIKISGHNITAVKYNNNKIELSKKENRFKLYEDTIENLFTVKENKTGKFDIDIYGKDGTVERRTVEYVAEGIIAGDVSYDGELMFKKAFSENKNYQLVVLVDGNGKTAGKCGVQARLYKNNTIWAEAKADFYLDTNKWSSQNWGTDTKYLSEVTNANNIIVKFDYNGKKHEMKMPTEVIKSVIVKNIEIKDTSASINILYSPVCQKGKFEINGFSELNSVVLKKGKDKNSAYDIKTIVRSGTSRWISSFENLNEQNPQEKLYFYCNLIKAGKTNLGQYKSELEFNGVEINLYDDITSIKPGTIVDNEKAFLFSKRGEGKGQVLKLKIKWDRKTRKATSNINLIKYIWNTSAIATQDVIYTDTFNQCPYKFNIETIEIYHNDNLKKEISKPNQPDSETIDVNLGELEKVNSGDKIKVTVGLTWLKEKNLLKKSARTYYYDIEIKINEASGTRLE